MQCRWMPKPEKFKLLAQTVWLAWDQNRRFPLATDLKKLRLSSILQRLLPSTTVCQTKTNSKFLPDTTAHNLQSNFTRVKPTDPQSQFQLFPAVNGSYRHKLVQKITIPNLIWRAVSIGVVPREDLLYKFLVSSRRRSNVRKPGAKLSELTANNGSNNLFWRLTGR